MHSLPILMLVYISIFFEAGTISSSLLAFAIVRAYRWIWQSSDDAGLEFSIALIVRRSVPSDWAGGIPFVLQFLCVSFLHSRFNDFTGKLANVYRVKY